MIGSPGEFDKDPMKRTDRLFKLRSYLGAVDQQHELETTTTEDSSTPRLQRDAQHTDALHTVQVPQFRCERGIRRMEAVRDEMGAKVSWTPDEHVVLSTHSRHTDTVGGG